MSKEIAQRTPQEIERLLNATSGNNLPNLIRHHLGSGICDDVTANKIAVTLNRKWLLEIKPNLPDIGQIAIDDARIKHADNITGALKELGAAIRASGDVKNLQGRAIALYETRSADSNCKKDLPKGHRHSSIMPNGGFGITR